MREKEVKGKLAYDGDSRRYHRFLVNAEQGVVGSVYIPKGIQVMPTRLILEYDTNQREEKTE